MAPVRDARGGFLLLDVALALAIVLLAAAIVWPAIPRGTTSAGLAATVMDVATLLRADRTGALRDGRRVGTVIDLDGRTVQDAGGRTVTVPRDLAFELVTATACALGDQRYQITFNPDGSSCGGVVRLAKSGRSFRIRINWLTGWIDVVGPEQS